MANEMMYANILAQAHMTAIQTVLKAIDFSAFLVEDSINMTKISNNAAGEAAFSTVLIPRDKIEEFKDECSRQDLFYLMPGEIYKVNGESFQFIDTDPLSDFIMVKTKAPQLALREDGLPLLDENGKEFFVPGSDKDLVGISILANRLNHGFLEERAAMISKDYALTSHEANDKWANIDTVTISDLKLSEFELLQSRASDLKIGSFGHFDPEQMSYALELPAESFARNPLLPNMMAPAEALVTDYIFAKNCPKIKDFMEYDERRHNELSSALINVRTDEGLDKDITIMCTKGAKFEGDYALPPMAVRLHDNYAEVLSPEGLKMEMIDMRDHDSYMFVSDMISKFDKDYLILGSDQYESVVGKWMYVTDDKDNLTYNENGDPEIAWMAGSNKDLWDRYIGCHIDERLGFEELKDEAFEKVAELRDKGRIDYEFNDASECKMFEARIPESDTVIADTIVTNFEADLDFVNTEKERDLIKHDIELAGNDLKVSLASHYCETPAFIKKNRTEQLLDQSGREYTYLEKGEPLPPSLTPEEFSQYYESLGTLVDGYDIEGYVDYDAYDNLLQEEYNDDLEEDLDFEDSYSDNDYDPASEDFSEFDLTFDADV